MTGWIILGVIVALILLVLLAPIRLFIRYHDERLDWEARYLFFRATPAAMKKRKQKKDAKKADEPIPASESAQPDSTDDKDAPKPDQPAAEDAPDKPKRKAKKEKKPGALSGLKPTSLEEAVELARNFLDSSHKPLRRILKGFHIKKLDLDLTIGAPDAYTCAMRFGRANILVYNTLGYLSQFFSISAKRVAVRADFDKEHGVYNASCVMQMAPITALSAAVGFILRFFVNTRKAKSRQTRQKVAA